MVKDVRARLAMFFRVIALTLATTISIGSVGSIASTAWAAECTLLSVPKPDGAKHKVYFTKFLKEDNTGGRYKKCRIVTKAEAGTESFFVTPFRQDATLVVHKDNWP